MNQINLTIHVASLNPEALLGATISSRNFSVIIFNAREKGLLCPATQTAWTRSECCCQEVFVRELSNLLLSLFIISIKSRIFFYARDLLQFSLKWISINKICEIGLIFISLRFTTGCVRWTSTLRKKIGWIKGARASIFVLLLTCVRVKLNCTNLCWLFS